MRTDGQRGGGRAGGVRSRDYQIFWDGYIYLPMMLRRRASRARAPLLMMGIWDPSSSDKKSEILYLECLGRVVKVA